tara:strand:+ start:746 stop:1069 length:324 start_codon:yes stop_codon:yes gene_type:complete
MAYGKIENSIVVFKTYETDLSLTEIPDNVCCGMIQNEDGTFSNPPKTNEQLFDEIRNKRDQLLVKTDVYALSDRNITNAMKKYRQDLRDLPASNSDPSKIVFPTKPE